MRALRGQAEAMRYSRCARSKGTAWLDRHAGARIHVLLSSLAMSALCVLFMGCSVPHNPSASWAEMEVPDETSDFSSPRQTGAMDEDGSTTSSAPATAQEHEELGDRYRGQGNLVLALSHYQKALRLDPGGVELRYKIGKLFLLNDRPQKAQGYFLEAIGQNAEHAPSFEGLGQASFQMNHLEESEKYFLQALALEPARWSSHAFLGILHDRRGRHHDAARSYLAALDHQPNHPELYNNLGVSYYLDGQYERAAQAFRDALRTGSAEGKTYNNLGLALSSLGNYQEGFEAFLKGGQRFSAFNNVGTVLLKAGHPEEAMTCFRRAIDENPTYYETANENLRRARRAFVNHASHNSRHQLTDSPCRSGPVLSPPKAEQ